MQVIASVHNLTEMAERPYTLSLIVREFETIERWKAEGRKVTGVTLYRHLVRSWLERDADKHQIQPDHKQAIMEHLAAALWRSGQRLWRVADLEEWLLDFLDDHPKMKRHYREKGLEQLKEDLRSATFLVRDGDDQFRFGHTSLQEFFLAGYLRRGLLDNQPDRWAMNPVSIETLDFLGQWLEEDGENRSAAIATLGRMRDSWLPQASEQAFLYCVHAEGRNYPAPSTEGFQLPGANLTGREFRGNPTPPIRLGRMNLTGARLWNTRWRHCDLSHAVLKETDVTGAEFLHCGMAGSDWTGGVLEATTFRHGQLSRAIFANVRGRQISLLTLRSHGCRSAARGTPRIHSSGAAIERSAMRRMGLERARGYCSRLRVVAGRAADSVNFSRRQSPALGCRDRLRTRPTHLHSPYHDGPTWATIDHRNNRILACHPEAWRILGWRTNGPDGFPVILPAETFDPLPVRQ